MSIQKSLWKSCFHNLSLCETQKHTLRRSTILPFRADQAVHAANAKAGSILLSLSARHGPEIASLLHRLASNCQVAEATRQGGGNATGDDSRAESYSRFREFENSRNRKIRNSLSFISLSSAARLNCCTKSGSSLKPIDTKSSDATTPRCRVDETGRALLGAMSSALTAEMGFALGIGPFLS